MTSNLTPVMDGLYHLQYAIDVLEDIYQKDTKLDRAIREMKYARSRIVEVVRRDTREE